MKAWYYAQGDQQYGPITKSELLDLVKSGNMDRGDLVWTSGMEDWQSAHSVDGLLTTGQTNTPTSSPAADGRSIYSGDSIVVSPADQDRDSPATDSVGNYAGFWKRLFAALIDLVVLIFVGFVVGLAVLYSGSQYGLSQEELDPLVGGIGLLIGWLYYASLEGSYTQATLGKMAVGVKVTDEEFGKIGFGKATGRHFGKLVSGIILMIGYIMIAFTDKKQALHDKMAGCLVVNR